MGWYTDFFIADREDAEAIAVDEDEDAFEGWPHLALKDVGVAELGALWAAIRGQADTGQLDVSGDLLYPDDLGPGGYEGALVSELSPAFVQDLAALGPADRYRAAAAWARSDLMTEWDPATARAVLDELADFARRAVADRKPVLQMSVL